MNSFTDIETTKIQSMVLPQHLSSEDLKRPFKFTYQMKKGSEILPQTNSIIRKLSDLLIGKSFTENWFKEDIIHKPQYYQLNRGDQFELRQYVRSIFICFSTFRIFGPTPSKVKYLRKQNIPNSDIKMMKRLFTNKLLLNEEKWVPQIVTHFVDWYLWYNLPTDKEHNSVVITDVLSLSPKEVEDHCKDLTVDDWTYENVFDGSDESMKKMLRNGYIHSSSSFEEFETED